MNNEFILIFSQDILNTNPGYILTGISDKVKFYGNVSNPEIRRIYELSDDFVLASRTEERPRALIGSMSVGMPSISATVG